ncbi:MAG: FAD-dependent oxidoreductase [Cellvibrionaceae bacterium]
MGLRETNLDKLEQSEFDVLIVGGGINGAVSAASLSAKGVKVALIDRGDFAGFTSSNSSNLAWGGIKYLESHEYLLVNELCKSRNHLMESYPSTVQEIRFLTSIQQGFRFHPWFIYLGTLLYWVLGRFRTRPPLLKSATKLKSTESIINVETVAGGFEYSDCYLFDNDARFVFNFIRSSIDRGCVAVNYAESVSSNFSQDEWRTEVVDQVSQRAITVKSKVVINACGPYVDEVNRKININTDHHHAFSKGIHLIVDRLTEEKKVLAFFADDGRLFFVIPMGPKTCIGTTDTPSDDPRSFVTEEDRQFVLDNVNRMLDLEQPLTADDIISERCGVRPLAVKGQSDQEWMQMSRKHALDVDADKNHISVFGGKLTDCLNVGDEVCDLVQTLGVDIPLPETKWYGESSADVRQEFFHQAALMGLDELTPATSSEVLSQRFWRRYGSDAVNMLERIRENPRQSELLIEHSEYLRCEIEHAARKEMIVKLEDFLRRRSKISLVVRQQDLLAAPGLKEACQILFGDEADVKFKEYVDSLNSDKESILLNSKTNATNQWADA